MNPLHINTPLVESPAISKEAGIQISLKLEITQPVGSFKIRGIGHLCQQAVQDGKSHFISSSGGNAGFAAAYAGQKLGAKTTVVVPSTTPRATMEKIEEQQAEVVVKGDVWDETDVYARDFAGEVDGLYVPPFDHPLIWEGHSTMIDEIVQQTAKPDAIILSVGGGGLLCGVLMGLHKNNWQDVPVIAVETEGTASFAATQQAGRLITLDNIDSIAKTLAAKTVSAQVLEWTGKHKIQSVLVTDKQTVTACTHFVDDYNFFVEPACGAALAVAYEKLEVLKPYKSAIIIVCGGIGADSTRLKEWQKIVQV